MIEHKIIEYPNIARKLLHMGHRIVDIKPKHENPQATLFVFAVTGNFMEDCEKLKAQWEEQMLLEEQEFNELLKREV